MAKAKSKIPTPEELLKHLLRRVGEPGVCRGCGADIFWVVHLNGKKTPYTAAGMNHFIDCPKGLEFRKQQSGN